MQITKIIEGVTGSVRSAAAAVSQRLGNTLAGFKDEHPNGKRARRIAVVALAAAVLTGSGATAAWALAGEDEPAAPQVAAAQEPEESTEAEETTEEAVEEAAAEEEATSEEAAEAEEAEEAPEPAKEPAGPVVLDSGTAGLDSEQLANAVTIIETGKELGFEERGWAVALATAMQEAKMYNAASEAVPESFEYTDSSVTYSDHDSVGIFQQRTSMGWGSVEELMDVSTSASKFYNTLAKVSGWEGMSIAQAAQAVQISAYPDHYAQWEDEAWTIIEAYESA